MSDIDWKGVIERQSRDLFFVMTEMFFMAGLNKGVPVTVLTRRVYRRILILLRPAEAALRRLIIIAARGIVLKVRPSGPFPKELAAKLKKMERASDAASDGLQKAGRIPVFNLIEPLKHFARPGERKPFQGRPTSFPRISVPGWSTPYFPPEPVPLTWRGPDQCRAAHPAHYSVQTRAGDAAQTSAALCALARQDASRTAHPDQAQTRLAHLDHPSRLSARPPQEADPSGRPGPQRLHCQVS